MNVKYVVALFFLLLSFSAFGAESEAIDFFRSRGKINVVVAVLVTIFVGIIVYLISLDRKISRLENRIKDE